jgi:hypothetical protein
LVIRRPANAQEVARDELIRANDRPGNAQGGRLRRAGRHGWRSTAWERGYEQVHTNGAAEQPFETSLA